MGLLAAASLLMAACGGNDNSDTGTQAAVLSNSSNKILGQTPVFDGGTKSFSATLKPGTYTYYCSVPGHREAGMQGTLTVK